MSVRRLAEDIVQPANFAFNRDNAVWAEATIRKYPEGRQQSAVIPLLMRAQEQEGWVTRAAIESIADMLDMPYIRALEVATFYTQFQLKPVGTKAHVQICGTTPCMLRGSEELIKLCRKKINARPFETNEAGTLSWEEVECQGACVNAPMVMIFKDTYEDLTPERLEEIIDGFEAGEGASVRPGPQNGRHLSAPVGGLTSLKDQAELVGTARDQHAEHRTATTAPANGAGADVPSQKGRPAAKVPPEGDPSLKEPEHSEGPLDPVEAEALPEVEGEHTLAKSRKTRAARDVSTAPDQAPTESAAKSRRDLAATTQPASGNVSDKNRPASAERPEQPDDLKLISGIGPRIEAKLNDLGIWTYGQVAGWKKAEREWVDNYLRFSGRIERDDWVRQAKALAKGGEAEYIRVFGKKPR